MLHGEKNAFSSFSPFLWTHGWSGSATLQPSLNLKTNISIILVVMDYSRKLFPLLKPPSMRVCVNTQWQWNPRCWRLHKPMARIWSAEKFSRPKRTIYRRAKRNTTYEPVTFQRICQVPSECLIQHLHLLGGWQLFSIPPAFQHFWFYIKIKCWFCFLSRLIVLNIWTQRLFRCFIWRPCSGVFWGWRRRCQIPLQ